MTIGDNRDYIRVLLNSYYITITGWGVLLRNRCWRFKCRLKDKHARKMLFILWIGTGTTSNSNQGTNRIIAKCGSRTGANCDNHKKNDLNGSNDSTSHSTIYP